MQKVMDCQGGIILMKIEEKIAQALVVQKKTLGVAESCTGGLLSHRLTNIPGCSDFLKLGVVAYSNEAKIKCLKVSQEDLKKHGSVSEEVAMAMASGVRQLAKTGFGIGITGIAGPTGGTKKKSVGLVYIAVNTKDETLCLKCQFEGTRSSIKSQSSTQALYLLLEFLL